MQGQAPQLEQVVVEEGVVVVEAVETKEAECTSLYMILFEQSLNQLCLNQVSHLVSHS